MLKSTITYYRHIIFLLLCFSALACSEINRSNYVDPAYTKYNQYGVSLIEKNRDKLKYLESHTILNSGYTIKHAPFHEVYKTTQFNVFVSKNNNQILEFETDQTDKHRLANIYEYISTNTLDYLNFVLPDTKFNFIIKLLPNGVNVNEVKTHKVLNSVLTLDFTFNYDKDDTLNSLNNIIRTLVHEALHANAKLNNLYFPNKLSEETIVYLNEVCAELRSTNKLVIPSFNILPDDNFMAHVYQSDSPKIIKNMEHLGYSIIAKTLAQKVIWDLKNLTVEGQEDSNELNTRFYNNCKKLYLDAHDFNISFPSYLQ